MTSIILYCRPGFEKECGAEIQEKAAWNEIFGYLQLTKNEGLVYFHLNDPKDGEILMQKIPLRRLIFARDWFVTLTDKIELPDYNRVEAITEELGTEWKYADLRMEMLDTNEGKAFQNSVENYLYHYVKPYVKRKSLWKRVIMMAQYYMVYF